MRCGSAPLKQTPRRRKLRTNACCLQEKLKAFETRLIEERKKRLEDRKRQRKEERRNTFYRQKEEEAQRIHEEQLKKGLWRR